MEKRANILYLGDTYTEHMFHMLQQNITSRYSKEAGYAIQFYKKILKRGITDKLSRVSFRDVQVVVVNLGVYECIENKAFLKERYACLIKSLLNCGCRVIVCTLPPLQHEKQFNRIIVSVAEKYKIRIANIALYWKFERVLKPQIVSGIYNDDAIALSVKAVIPVLTRTKMLVLWQYNGRYAHCNYSCPYCYVATSVNKGMHIVYGLDKWEKAFERHFGEKDTVFYFSYGEPTMGGKLFYEALDMIGRHKNWQVRITTNISVPLNRLLDTELARDGRLNINASFHPSQVSISKFIEQCNRIRSAGIEPSIIYVMYPDQIDDFETKYMPIFRENQYRVHVRAFRGLYHGKKYPQAYTKVQWEKTARYMDRGNFKYQLHAVNGLGRMSMLGVTHILVDNYGKIEMCDSYVGDRHYGNVFDEEINLDLEPHPFPGLVPLAAVDDIADYVEMDYGDLENNNVNDFNTQGGVTVTPDGEIVYPYEKEDFSDKDYIKKLCKVPQPMVPAYYYWMNPKWIYQHFLYSFIIKKYGKYILAWVKGKLRLIKAGKLSLKNFWHG